MKISKHNIFMFGIAFACLGLVTLLLSHANPVFVSLEPEATTPNAPAIVGSDAAASGGKYIQFGATGPSNPCTPTTPLPANADPGTIVIADGFETGDFSKWTNVAQEGDATAVVQSATIKTGTCAAKVHVTSNSGSRANISKTLPAASREIWATGWFNVTREGTNTGSNVPTFRFFNGTTRLLDIARQNGSGAMFVRWATPAGYSINSVGKTLAVNQWYQIKVHAVASGATSQVQVWLDGTSVLDRTTAATGYASFGSFTNITSVMVGAEHVLQDGDFAADDVILKVLP